MESQTTYRRLVRSTRLRDIKKKLPNVCRGCGISKDNLEADHVFPLSLGGRDELDNIQLLCPHCHRIKTNNHRRSLRSRVSPDGRVIEATNWLTGKRYNKPNKIKKGRSRFRGRESHW